MKNLFGHVFFLSGLFFGFTEYLLGQNASRSGHDYAIFIYTSDFDEKWVDLPNIPKEIELIEKELINNYGFKCDIISNPTKEKVVGAFAEINSKYKFELGDQVLIFISTHGYKKETKSGGLAFKDGKPWSDDPTEKTLLSYGNLKNLIQNIRCNHVLLALDACYSGVFADEFKDIPDLPVWQKESTCQERVVESLRGRANLYFTSVGKDERSPSESAFALRFLNRLQEKDDDGIISYYELYSKLLGNVRPKPHSGEFALTHEKGSDFVFIRKNVCTDDAKKETITQFKVPTLKPANLKDPPVLNTLLPQLKNADLLALTPCVEGGFAAFGYFKKNANKITQNKEASEGGGEDFCLLLVDRFNKVERVLSYGKKGNERAISGIQTYDGGYALVGFTDSEDKDAKGGRDCYILKVNLFGEYVWHYRVGTKSDEQYNKIIQMDDGSLVAVGRSGYKPIISVFSNQGELLFEFLDIPIRGGEGEITCAVKTPYDDLLIGGNCGNGKIQEPFMLRFSLETGERIGNAFYLDKNQEEYHLLDLNWNLLDQIILLCSGRSIQNKNNVTLFYLKDNNSEFVFSQKPINYGGDGSDTPTHLYGDIFGNTYITGAGKSYKNKGGLFDRLFLIEVDKNGKSTGDVGWQGSFKGSHGNALAILPGRRLIVAGQESPEIPCIQHFNLGINKNEDPRLFFNIQSTKYFDGNLPSDGKLEPNENGWYMLRIENKGDYASGAIIQVDLESQKVVLKYPKNLYLGDIAAGSAVFISLPISATPDAVPGSTTTLKLSLIASGKKIGEPIVIAMKH